jgi:adenylate cyclase
VKDEFELSRSFGMFNLLPAVNARPDVEFRELVEGDEFVILANRGIWDYVSYQTAVDIAREDRSDPMLAAQKLRDFALSYGADGSTMCMIVSISDLFAAPIAEIRVTRGQQDQIADKNLIRLGREVDPPTGQVTLVFSDIRNSTHLWEVNPGMRTAIHLHNRLLRRLLRTIGGYEVKTEGDAFMVSFPSPLPAILWSLSVQTQLLLEDWPLEILESTDGRELYDSEGTLLARGLSVRMGIHVGYPNCEPDPVTRRMDYFGPMVNRTARICGSADGGQIMCSADVMKALQERVSNDGTLGISEIDGNDAWSNVVDEIRRIKYVAIAVGEKKMKGLELPELVSILYARELAGRHNLQSTISEGKADTTSSQVPFSVAQIIQFATLCLRLEALSTSRVFRHISQRKTSKIDEEDEEDESRILYADPGLLLPPIPDHASASHLMLVLDMLTVRMENALATLALQRRGISIESMLAQMT